MTFLRAAEAVVTAEQHELITKEKSDELTEQLICGGPDDYREVYQFIEELAVERIGKNLGVL